MPVKCVPRKLHRTKFFLVWSPSRLLLLVNRVNESLSFAVNHNLMYYEDTACEVCEVEKC